jgi:hypothetical protein
MSREGRGVAEHSSLIPGSQSIQREKGLRVEETTLERDISTYRAYGYNVQPAAWEKWLGSEALGRGDRTDAAMHFQKAAMDLRQVAEAGRYAPRSDNSFSTLNGNETSQVFNGAAMHSNRTSRSVY